MLFVGVPLHRLGVGRDLRPKALTGSKMEKICDKVHITLNKNAVQVSHSDQGLHGEVVAYPAP